jgi:hypothetical protein
MASQQMILLANESLSFVSKYCIWEIMASNNLGKCIIRTLVHLNRLWRNTSFAQDFYDDNIFVKSLLVQAVFLLVPLCNENNLWRNTSLTQDFYDDNIFVSAGSHFLICNMTHY